MSDFKIISGEYTYLPIERVHFGPGIVEGLAGELDRLGSTRPFLITGRSIAEDTDLAQRVEKASKRDLSGIFSGIKQHAPLGRVMEAAREARKQSADSLISLGGGSPIDSTKIVVNELSEHFRKPAVPHIAVPTTLSAAEFSHIAGTTDEASKRKMGFRDARLVPRIVFLDPELTVPTPPWLWASTGIRSLDHAVESILSPRHQPWVDTLALEAVRLIFENLKASTDHPKDLEKRLACQTAAWMSFAGVLSVGTGLSHAIGRVIGATWNIPHGITSCLTLAEVMKSETDSNQERLAAIAEAEGRNVQRLRPKEAAIEAAEAVREFVANLGLSKRLSDYGIRVEDLPRIAKDAAEPQDYARALRVLEQIL